MISPPRSRSAFADLLRLLKPFWPLVTVSIVLGMVGGLSITVLLATINNALNSEAGLTGNVVAAFAGLCLLALCCSILS
ncbi:cyclic peptide transporter, partial [Pseudomonas shirazensis]